MGSWYYYLHFIDEKTGSQRIMNIPKVPRLVTDGTNLNPGRSTWMEHFGRYLLLASSKLIIVTYCQIEHLHEESH